MCVWIVLFMLVLLLWALGNFVRNSRCIYCNQRDNTCVMRIFRLLLSAASYMLDRVKKYIVELALFMGKRRMNDSGIVYSMFCVYCSFEFAIYVRKHVTFLNCNVRL